MKIFLAFLLVICIVLPFASCENSKTPEETTGLVIVETELNLSEYRIIVSEKQSELYKSICDNFVKNLRDKSGLDFEYTDDFLKENPDFFYEAEHEILIGDTNRKESKIDETQSGNSYIIKHTNKKVVINAENPYALEYALGIFLDSYVKEDTEIIKFPDISDIYITEELYFNKLEGKTLTALGDSYFNYGKDKPEDRWINLLSEKYEMTLINCGIGGSAISNNQKARNNNPMVDRLDKLPEKTDIILFEGGRNDYAVNIPLGQIGSRDTTTFAGACNYIIDFLQEKYPDALIICITTWYYGDGTENYANMMKKVCENRGVVCFDATNQSVTQVYMNDANFRLKYSMSKDDKSHLNAAGMKLVLPVFENFIGEEYNKFLENKMK